MSLFGKLFRKKSNSDEETSNTKERSKYMPDVELPIDERFTVKFKTNGGKFLYCEHLNDVFTNFEHILSENDWTDKEALIFNSDLVDLFKKFNLKSTKINLNSPFFITTCEYLIANDGSVLISSNQIAEKRLKDLPNNIILYATTSQLVANISDGLKGIKQKSKISIPTNITAIKHFKPTNENNFLTYGSSSKNLYLLLLEDL